ncbi:hypothetical protein [Microcystis aeruginosa]|uniref:Uncharacterized protein n=1 Tax=Microcystis aeruginosa PCC 7806SL TaxID=1903187 RepID=A0AB33BJY5_MICA7|nr:hypothetical protein [Microcystis aeruginosa]ARI79391.1 hypothetical protein BH695_0108 [Microcystis aeruginosa PCC 7806SL]ELS48948.1 hypothetical protein C789_1268 [Microcystis aeruginosa FACHB-905 = DIANCHI905]UGS08846.1 hypothetical protein LRR78_22560 [Microcystis aeruginosa FACHB-905 = DIANCHI905]WKX62790.1 hypothetical protein Q3H53_002828 [Microcystis aeruginosa PCC 7806]
MYVNPCSPHVDARFFSASFFSWDDFLEYHRFNPNKLIDWIKQNHPELVEKAKNGNLSISFWQKLLNSELVRVNPRDLHGGVMVTDAIKKESKLTAGIQTISIAFPKLVRYTCFLLFCLLPFAFCLKPITFVPQQTEKRYNVWNTVGVVPIAYAGVGGGVSGVISAVIVIGLCQLAGNYTSTAASNANPASRKWANRSLWANISLQGVLTLISGVGSEILTNSAQLSKIYADKVVEEHLYATPRRNIAEGERVLEQAKVAQNICDNKAAEYQKERDKDKLYDPKTSSLYEKLHGPHGVPSSYFDKIPTADLPYCRKPKRLEDDGKKLREQGQKQLDTVQSTVEQSGGSLEYLKKKKRGLYSQHFTENGGIAAGQEAVSTSMGNFSSKLLTGEWDKLGFPLMFASLSVIFSSASILMTL